MGDVVASASVQGAIILCFPTSSIFSPSPVPARPPPLHVLRPQVQRVAIRGHELLRFRLCALLALGAQDATILGFPLLPVSPDLPQAPPRPRMSPVSHLLWRLQCPHIVLLGTQEFDAETGPQGCNSILLPPRVPLSLAFESPRALY